MRAFFCTTVTASTLALGIVLAGCQDSSDPTRPPTDPKGILAAEVFDGHANTRLRLYDIQSGQELRAGPSESGEPTIHGDHMIYTQRTGEGAHLILSDLRFESEAVLRPGVQDRETAARWSPDGLKVSFLVEGPEAGIWLSEIKGARSWRLLPDGFAPIQGRHDWDGGRIVFESAMGGRGAILRSNGNLPPVPVHAPGHVVYHPRVSPNGRYIAVLAASEARRWAEVVDRQRNVYYEVAGTTNADALAWSESEELIVAVREDSGDSVLKAWMPGSSVRRLFTIHGVIRSMEISDESMQKVCYTAP